MAKAKNIQIKIGHQKQANKEIFLLSNGNIICGGFTYTGRYTNKFKKYYVAILNHLKSKPKNEVVDASLLKYWDARSINEYMTNRWQQSITFDKIEDFANETTIAELIADIIPEFKRALGLRWRRVFKESANHTPKNAWEIL